MRETLWLRNVRCPTCRMPDPSDLNKHLTTVDAINDPVGAVDDLPEMVHAKFGDSPPEFWLPL